MEEEFAGQVDLLSLDADRETDLARELGVRAIPTLIGYREGRPLTRVTGVLSRSELTGLFEAVLTGRGVEELSLPGPREYLLRLGTGIVLAGLGWLAGPSWVLMGLGGLIAITGLWGLLRMHR